MNAQSASLFTWPQTSLLSTQLDFGRLSGLSYEEGIKHKIKWSSANNPTHKQLHHLTSLTQVFPHTRRYNPTVNATKDSENHNALQSLPTTGLNTNVLIIVYQVKYLQERYPEFDIPSEFLVDTLVEESNKETNYDPYMSAQLISFGDLGQTNKFIAFPMGQTGSELCFTSMKYHEKPQGNEDIFIGQYQLDLSAISKLKFKTPIRQITTSSPITTSSHLDSISLPPLMAILDIDVETDNSVEKRLKALTLDAVPGLVSGSTLDQMHVAFNPMLYGEAAIVDAGGGVHLWRAERNQQPLSNVNKFEVESIKSSQAWDYAELPDLWRACEFAAHPRCLLVASRETVDLLDFRVTVSNKTTNLFSASDGDQIFAFQRVPAINTFQSILATRNSVVLLDQRYPNRTLLKWIHHNDKPTGLSTIVDGKTTDFPISIPSFHEHPTFSRSKYLRPTLANQQRLYQSTEEKQPLKLPPLASVLLLRNDAKYWESDVIENPVMCFSAIQLSHTGALYSQDFCLSRESDFLPVQDKLFKTDDTQIIKMPDSVMALQVLADKDLGINPEMQLKRHRIWPFDRIWNYAAREFRFPFYNDTNSKALGIYSAFLSWESVETYFKDYAQSTGFGMGNYSKILMDLDLKDFALVHGMSPFVVKSMAIKYL
ncbi:2348_t:CDS:10 [Acaulospora colombiana]|uniref:2348_t:CDS:1 n=1 Tax=Acaulospora colombiana TaxID=27376 RepID=A0ACA9KMD8_9GLOM|nr:2348_t:CDS:10 [Acaulospora colombiana]